MALFGGNRDIDFFRSITSELINDIIETYVDLYKKNLNETRSNMYGESTTSIYLDLIRIPCLINRDAQSSDLNEFGKNNKQTARFSFMRDKLVELNAYVQEGDIFHWNNQWWEVDHIEENKLFMNRNPETNKDIGDYWGWNVSLNCSVHLTNARTLDIQDTNQGDNEDYL